jgi:hypothetical protein
MIRRLFRWLFRRRQDEFIPVRREWLDDRNAFHGVPWSWPVRKRINEASQFNSRRLRRKA